MITFSKNISELVCYKNIDGEPDIVHTVVWTLKATNDEGQSETFGMRTEIPNLANAEFVPFETLTEDIVQSWIDLFTPPLRLQSAMKYLEETLAEKEVQIARTPPWWIIPTEEEVTDTDSVDTDTDTADAVVSEPTNQA